MYWYSHICRYIFVFIGTEHYPFYDFIAPRHLYYLTHLPVCIFALLWS